jgi:hypothetical protein
LPPGHPRAPSDNLRTNGSIALAEPFPINISAWVRNDISAMVIFA